MSRLAAAASGRREKGDFFTGAPQMLKHAISAGNANVLASHPIKLSISSGQHGSCIFNQYLKIQARDDSLREREAWGGWGKMGTHRGKHNVCWRCVDTRGRAVRSWEIGKHADRKITLLLEDNQLLHHYTLSLSSIITYWHVLKPCHIN